MGQQILKRIVAEDGTEFSCIAFTFSDGKKVTTLAEAIADKRYVVMQSTGLHDKNGKEIFEGDILDWNGIGRAVVEWSEGDADFLLEYPEGSLGGFDTRPTLNGLSSAKTPYYEVIGNIYENPDLLPSPSL